MLAHGVSRGMNESEKTSRGAATERGTALFLRPIQGLAISTLGPTARAVGYRLTLLRSYASLATGAWDSTLPLKLFPTTIPITLPIMAPATNSESQ